MLEIRQLAKHYPGRGGTVCALGGVSLRLDAGQFVAIRGPSGSGKTTLLLAAGGLLRPDGGQVLFEGEDVYAWGKERRNRYRAGQIGFVFQQFHLLPYLSVMDNVLCPSLAQPRAEAGRRAAELMEEFGLADRAGHVPAELSTGQRQRVALARALLNRPRLLLADEPTGNLDEASGQAVLRHLSAFAKAGGAVLLVTHDSRAAELADRVLRLEKGVLDVA